MNAIKSSGDGLALQITKPARSAELVEENSDGEATRLSKVRVYAYDNLLLVVDIERVSNEQIAELAIAAAGDTNSAHRTMDATVQIAGHGYQVQLPPAEDAGFVEGDLAGCHPAPGLIVISRDDGTSAGRDAARLAKDLVTIRRSHLE